MQFANGEVQALPVSKNRLINSNFAINQRNVSGTVTLSAGVYGHDRWKAGAGGCTYTFSTTANITTITITAGTLQQVVEGAQLFSGTHCLSWAGTATGRIDSGSYGASGVTGTATGGTNMTVEFGAGTVNKVQLEPSGTPSAWNPYFGIYGGEFQACQRYYQTYIGYTVDVHGGNLVIGMSYLAYQSNPIPLMRATPTSSSANFVSNLPGTGSVAVAASTGRSSFTVTVSRSGSGWNAGANTVSLDVILSAEL